MVRAAALPRRGLVALLVSGQVACAFDTGGGASPEPPGAGDLGGRPDAGLILSPDSAPPPAACPPEEELLACLTFDGSAEDESGYQNGIQVNGTPVFAAGLAGQALDASEGVDITILETSVLDPPAPLLVELWVRADSFPAEGARAGLVDNEGQWGFFVHPGGQVSCSMSGFLQEEAVLSLGTWAHLACAYDGTTVRLFKDGGLVGESSGGGTLSPGGTDGTAIGHNSPSGQYFDGLIDELRIWRRGAP